MTDVRLGAGHEGTPSPPVATGSGFIRSAARSPGADQGEDQWPFAVTAAGRRTRIKSTARRSIAVVLVMSTARWRRLRSTPLRRQAPAACYIR